MTLEALNARRGILKSELEQLRAKVAAYGGALEENQYWINQAEKEQEDDRKAQED